MHDLTTFIATAERAIADHAVAGPGPGAYRRWGRTPGSGEGSTSVYGCTDAAHLLYTLGRLPGDPAERGAWIRQLQSFQDPATGLFHSTDHHVLHTTAFTVGALDLFDARPLHPLRGLEPYATRDGVRGLLDGLNWTEHPWGESHRGAGIYGAMVLAGPAPAAWQDWYFEWLWENQDPATGLWRAGCLPGPAGPAASAPPFHHLAGTFHYLFNHDFARRALRFTEPLVDTCLDLHRQGHLPQMGVGLSWNEIDFLYTVRSLQKRTPYRAAETRALMEDIGEAFVRSVTALDPESDPGLADLHPLFAGLCSLAVLQEALPGFIRTPRPLRLVLDRRPFL